LRHVVFLKRGPVPVVVLYDDLEAVQPSCFQFMLHGLREFEVDGQQKALHLEAPHAGLFVQYLLPAPLTFRQWDGYDPKPTKPFPNQWHVQAGTQERQRHLEMLTVLVPYRAGQRPRCTMERREEEGAIGARLTIASMTAEVAFRRGGAAGEVRWQGQKFDGPVLVQGGKS